LTNAPERFTITLGSDMITIKWGGAEITCDNASEAASLLAQLGNQAQWVEPQKNPWNGVRFWSLIESLGAQQQKILKELLSKERISDQDLRAFLGLESNQQLAGVLSGISKQAASRDIPARTVFKIENEYSAGQSAKWYAVAPEFRQIAADSNWPDDKEEDAW
jgi:hypothetical protein